MSGTAASFKWLAITALLGACRLPIPLDFDGKPVQAVRLVGVFEGGVLVVQHSTSSARVIVELQAEEPVGAILYELSLRVGSEPAVRPTRLLGDQAGCGATARRDRLPQPEPEDRTSLTMRITPCLTRIRAEFLLPRTPTVNDSLFIITRDARPLPVRWYR